MKQQSILLALLAVHVFKERFSLAGDVHTRCAWP